MRVTEILQKAKSESRPVFSFEFFPPKNEAGQASLASSIAALRPLHPDFCSVTYGAGGSTQSLTRDLLVRMQEETAITPMAHLTCVGHSRGELRKVLSDFRAAGIDNVLALRGDPPKGVAHFEPAPGGLRYASELAQLARHEFDFCVGGACYPEGHVEQRDAELNIAHAREKVNAGAEFLITQLFFDPRTYFDYVARLRGAGIYVPVIPGIMPITDVGQVERFTSLCGAAIPERLRAELQIAREDKLATLQLGIAYATHQAGRLLEGGAPGVHFYTLNRSASTRAILAALRATYI